MYPKQQQRKAARGFATRTEERRQRMRGRLASAATADEQLGAAFDWFRSSARHMTDPAARSAAMHDMAVRLAEAAELAEKGGAR